MSTRRPSTDFQLGDEFARVLAETTQSLVCVLDEAGRALLFNDACERATGFSRDEVVGRDLTDTLIPPEESDAFREVLAYIWSSGDASPQVGHWRTKDGSLRLIAWSNRFVPATANAPAYLVASGIDLTAREESGEGGLADDSGSKLVEVSRLAQEQRALRRVATLVASEASPERVFMAVSTECARVLEVNASSVWRYEGDDTATVVAGFNRDGIDPFPLGTRLFVEQTTLIGHTRETGLPSRVDDWGTAEGEYKELMLRIGYRSTVAAPIIVAGTRWGAVTVSSADPLPANAEVRLAAFCDLVSLAVASAQAREDLQTSRSRIVRAGDEQRRRLERNLHDGAQQRLVAATLLLRVAQAKLEPEPEAAAKLLKDAAGELDAGLEELRELARGLHPGALTDHGLRGRAGLAGGASAATGRCRGNGRAPRPARRGDRVFHRFRGAEQRRQARTRIARKRDRREARRCPPDRDRRQRHGRRRHLQGNRPARPPRPGRGGRRHPRRDQPARPRHADHRDAAARRALSAIVAPTMP